YFAFQAEINYIPFFSVKKMTVKETENVPNPDSDTENDQVEEAPVYEVRFLKLIKEAQQQHGLRHGDYQRYRGYCARKIRRVRKALNFVQGDKKHFRKKEVTQDSLHDERYFLILLMSAERAWSYAMQLKQEANTEPRKKFHMVSRLKKAVAHAIKLEAVCESNKCHAVTKLESQAYSAWLTGFYLFEKQKWADALQALTKAQNRCKLDIFNPRIKKCWCCKVLCDVIYRILQNLIAQTREKQAATLSEVTWRKRTVPVKSEKVRRFLTNAKEAEKSAELGQGSSKVQLQFYEKLLMECKDAIQVLRDELKNDPSYTRRGAAGEPMHVSSLHYLHSYLIKSGAKPAKPQEYIRLYEGILASLTEMGNLPGLEEDFDSKESCDAQATAYRALRCFHIAESFQLVKRWPECVAMFDKSSEYVNKASNLPALGKSLKDRMSELGKKVEHGRVAAQASCVSLGDDELVDDFKSLSVLADHLDVYLEEANHLANGDGKLVQFPPEFQPVLCKPLFFDLAWNHVEFPSLEHKLDVTPAKAKKVQAQAAPQQQQTGGLTGFVKGLWGWGSK
ncbi:unnamed protein product, partial [Notodromas monacha]